jgi:hypothetical protein
MPENFSIPQGLTKRGLVVFMDNMNSRMLLVLSWLLLNLSLSAAENSRPETFCNPMDLNYRFRPKDNHQPRREAADPTMVWFNNEYWLFASKSGGYWRSADMKNWSFVAPTGLPLEDYAPTAEVIAGKLYFTAYDSKAIYTTDNPADGQWRKVADAPNFADPALFADDDGRVYMYDGCAPNGPIKGVELDAKTFTPIGERTLLFAADRQRHGWENKQPFVSDEDIAKGGPKPYVEGAWMNKHKDLYYLQYSAPGTELKTYADGVYISEKPLGPYRYEAYSPFDTRAAGFCCGTGHGSTFRDPRGNYWHIGSAIIGKRHMFERRLAVYPAGFVSVSGEPDQLVCDTYLGDYPQFVPGVAADPLKMNSPGWMLLSYKKTVTASSALDGFAPESAVDENLQTWWSAADGQSGQWLQVDLGKPCRIEAVQVNFADQDAVAYGREEEHYYQWLLEVSDDGAAWRPLIDRRDSKRDAPHDYTQLPLTVTGRYLKLTNTRMPAGAKFSVSGLRVFGHGDGKAPLTVSGVEAKRLENKRLAKVNWSPSAGADFYIVRYGLAPGRLYSNIQVYDKTELDLTGLNTDVGYFVSVDAVNDSGVTMGTRAVPVK